MQARAHLIGVALIAIVGGARPAASSPHFVPAFEQFPSPSPATALAVGDFNEDGRPDVVLGSSAGSAVFVLCGLAGTAFQPAVSAAAGSAPIAVAVGDVNGDGHLDLVTANKSGNSVSVLRGHGDGTFDQPSTVPAMASPIAVALADVNLDGHLDLLVLASAVTVQLGVGDGTFGPVVSSLNAGLGPTSMAVGEATRDAYPDVVVATTGNPDFYNDYAGIHIFQGRGDGTFESPRFVGDAYVPTYLVRILDVDADGLNDICASRRQPPTVNQQLTVYFGNLDSSYGGPTPIPGSNGASDVVLADMQSDGIPDLVTTFGSGVQVYAGLGDRSFAAPVLYGAGCDARGVAVVDVNSDGAPDVVAATGRGLSLLHNYGAGVLGHYLRGFAGSCFIAAGDVNRDGNVDLAVAKSASGVVQILFGHGNGSFSPAAAVPVPWPFGTALTDVNGDGVLDLIVMSSRDSLLEVHIGNGDGTFGGPLTQRTRDVASDIATGDLDGDGVPDVVVGCYHAVTVLLSRGDGTFRARVDLPASDQQQHVVVADVTGDGIADIASTEANGGAHAFVWVNAGNGLVYTQQPHDLSAYPWLMAQTGAIAAGDVDGDGLTDLAIGSASYHSDPCTGVSDLALLRSLGNGNFADPVFLELPPSDESLSFSDVDLDGRQDLIATSAQTGLVAVLPGNGSMTPGPQVTFGSGASAGSHVVADFDRDGLPDIVVDDGASSSLVVLTSSAYVTGVVTPPALAESKLDPAFPNPARFETRLTFSLPSTARAALRIYDLQGRLVKTIVNGVLPAGSHTLRWDRTTDRGGRVASGVYLYELRTGGLQRSGRIVMLE